MKFKCNLATVLILLSGLFGMSFSEEKTQDSEEVVVNYSGRIHFNNMGCIYRLNGLDFVFSPLVFNGSHNNVSFVDDVGAFFQEGENSLEIEAIHLPIEPKNGSISFCELSVTAIATNRKTGQKDSRGVTHLRVTLDDEGKFTTEQSKEFLNNENTATDLPTLTILERKTIDDVEWLNNDAVAQRNLTIYHPHRIFSWTTVKPLQNTPENFERVWQAYQEVIQAFTSRDEGKLADIFMPATLEEDRYVGYTGEGSMRWNMWLESFREDWKNNGFTPITVNKQDYELEISNNGKLFRLNKKGGIMSSPILYETSNGGSLYNFYFTDVEGTIRPGVL
ncbi:hypothetical protein [Ignatzschineria sp. LJL83]